MGFTFKVKVILKNINQEFNLTLPFGLTPPTGPRTGGVLRAAPAVGPRALRPCPLPDRLLRSLRQRVGPKGAGPPWGRRLSLKFLLTMREIQPLPFPQYLPLKLLLLLPLMVPPFLQLLLFTLRIPPISTLLPYPTLLRARPAR